MKRKIIFLFMILLISVTVLNIDVFASQRQIRKVVSNYWKHIQNNDLDKALKHYSVFYYVKRVYGAELRELKVSEKMEMIRLLKIMQLQNLKNLSRNLMKKETNAKISIHGIRAIRKIATCNMTLSYTAGEQKYDVELGHFMNKIKGKWKICDFRINGKWDSETMKKQLKNVDVKKFLVVLRAFFSPDNKMVNYTSQGREFTVDIPGSFVPVSRLAGKKADFGEICLAFERKYMGILFIKSSVEGEYKIGSLADKLRSNLIVSGSKIISDEFYDLNGQEVFNLTSYRIDKNMPGNMAFTDFTFLIKGSDFYTILVNSPDHLALKLFSYHKDIILESFRVTETNGK